MIKRDFGSKLEVGCTHIHPENPFGVIWSRSEPLQGGDGGLLASSVARGEGGDTSANNPAHLLICCVYIRFLIMHV